MFIYKSKHRKILFHLNILHGPKEQNVSFQSNINFIYFYFFLREFQPLKILPDELTGPTNLT